MQKLTTYILSQEADADIAAIFDYSKKEFGLNQAIKYVSYFDTIFKQLLQQPNLGKVRGEIKKGILSLSIGSHIVFYSIRENYIRIERVLHGRCDIPKRF